MQSQTKDLVLEKDEKRLQTIVNFLATRSYNGTDIIRLRVAALEVALDSLEDHHWHPSLVVRVMQLTEFADDEWSKLSELLAFEDE